MGIHVAAENALLMKRCSPWGFFEGGYPRLKGSFYKWFARDGQRIVLLRADLHDPSTLEKVR